MEEPTPSHRLRQSHDRYRGEIALLEAFLAKQAALSEVDLRMLLFIGSRRGAAPKELANNFDYATGTVTAIIDRLSIAGHVERTPYPTDRRRVIVQLTSSGEAIVAGALAFQVRAFGDLSDAERTAAADALDTLVNALASFRDDLNDGNRS